MSSVGKAEDFLCFHYLSSYEMRLFLCVDSFICALILLGLAVRNENRPSVNSRGVILNMRKQPTTIPINDMRRII